MAVKLFIGGLSFSTSTERLREAFAGAGTVGEALRRAMKLARTAAA